MQKSAGAESNKRLSFSIHINNHGTTNGRAANEMGNEMEKVNYDFVDRAIVGRAASARRKSELKDTRRLAGWLAGWLIGMSGRTLLGTDGASEPWRMMSGGGGSGRMRGVMVDVVGGW